MLPFGKLITGEGCPEPTWTKLTSPVTKSSSVRVALGTEDEDGKLNVTGTMEHPLHKMPSEHREGYLAMLEMFHLLHCLVSGLARELRRIGMGTDRCLLRIASAWAYGSTNTYRFMEESVPEENVFTIMVRQLIFISRET
jgi:hypothetical protein